MIGEILTVISELSRARELATVMDVVRRRARALVRADGATFVLRDGDFCFYAEEDAIGPLWKGRRFPLTACISGWSMLHREAAAIEDVYDDPRIPVEAYRPTFVRSLVMTPIRREQPIGAIGTYWAARHAPTAEEIELLQALGDATSLAVTNVELYQDLTRSLAETREKNRHLRALTWAAAHDLQEPLRTAAVQLQRFERRCHATLDEPARATLERGLGGVRRMQALAADLVAYARLAERVPEPRTTSLGAVVREALAALGARAEPEVRVDVADGPDLWADPDMLVVLFRHLLANGIEFARPGTAPHVRVTTEIEGGRCLVAVEDDGVGVPEGQRQQVFDLFFRGHPQHRHPGSGIGLALCKRIVELHGGAIAVAPRPGPGTAITFSLPVVPIGAAEEAAP